MRLCLLSPPGPILGLPASWGQSGALLPFQGVKERCPPLSSLSEVSQGISARYHLGHPPHARRELCPAEWGARLCSTPAVWPQANYETSLFTHLHDEAHVACPPGLGKDPLCLFCLLLVPSDPAPNDTHRET